MGKTSKNGEKKKSLISRLLKWSGIGILILIVLILVLPFFFKDAIVQFIKDTANENLTAQLDFKETDLSLISTFPRFNLSIHDLSLAGQDEFEGINLAKIKSTNLELDLMSVIEGNYEIDKIAIDGAEIYVKVLEDGKANYDIAKVDSSATEDVQEETTEPSDFSFALTHYEVTNSNVVYDDESLATFVAIKNLNHEGNISINNDLYNVTTKTLIDELTTNYEGVDYMDKVNTDVDFVVDMDLAKGLYTFKENNVKLNELNLHFDGWLELLEEEMNMDITYHTQEQSFKSLLSMVPGVYTKDFNDIKTNGTLALDGYVKGKMDSIVMPGLDLNLIIENAWLQYPDLPSKLDKIALNLNVNRKESADLNNTVVNLNKMHAEFDDNTLDANLKVKNAMTDPTIKSDVKAFIDLAKLKNVIPMSEGENYNGVITSNVHLAGNVSALENEEYQKFDATGDLKITDMLYQSPDLPYDTKIDSMLFLFSPKNLKLANFNAKIGESDLQASGTIDNYMEYYLKDELLKGSFQVNSSYFNLDELMYEDPATVPTEETLVEAQSIATDSVPANVIEVPKNIDFNLNTTIEKLAYDGLELSNMSGGVQLKEGVASLTDVSLGVLGGLVKVNGDYKALSSKKAHIDFAYEIENMNIPQSFEYFNTIQKLAPVAQFCKGNFSTKLKMNTDIDQNFEPVYESLSGRGNLLTNNVAIQDLPLLEKLADLTKINDLKSQTFDNLKFLYELRDGKIFVDTFPIQMAGINSKIAGSTAITEEIDYLIKMQIPREKLGSQANTLLTGALNQAADKGVNLNIGDVIPVDIRVGGTMLNPKLNSNMKDAGKDAANDLMDQGKELAKEKLGEEAQKIMEEAQKQADKINADAKLAADKIRSEAKVAADKVRAEGEKAAEQAKAEARAEIQKQKDAGYAEADKLIAQASNPIAKKVAEKAAEKLKEKTDAKVEELNKGVDAKGDKIAEESNKKAQKIEDEAEIKAKKIEDEAKAKSDLILENAQKKVDSKLK
ncbi:MAG: AsmA family protein [Flavobacteriales bacterium]|jgi:hypothetical protein|nr:AsmA family protein [Flavobacteriales bacterium]